MSPLFHDSTLAILLAVPFLAMPASGLSDGRAAGSMCCGRPRCLKQAVATGEPLCALGEHCLLRQQSWLGSSAREGEHRVQVLLPLRPARVGEVPEGWGWMLVPLSAGTAATWVSIRALCSSRSSSSLPRQPMAVPVGDIWMKMWVVTAGVSLHACLCVLDREST